MSEQEHNATESTLTIQARRIADLERRIEQARVHVLHLELGGYDDKRIEAALKLLTVPPIELDEYGRIKG